MLFVMLHDITFIVGEAASCSAQLDSVTLIYIGGRRWVCRGFEAKIIQSEEKKKDMVD